MEGNEDFCGQCGNRIREGAPLPAKSKAPLVALAGIPLAVIAIAVGIFVWMSGEKNTPEIPAPVSSVAPESQAVLEPTSEPEPEPVMPDWKQLYFDAARESCTEFFGMRSSNENWGSHGARSARLYDLDEDGVPELFLDYFDIGITDLRGDAFTLKNGEVVIQSLWYGDEDISGTPFLDSLYRNPQTGAYLGIGYTRSGANYYAYEDGEWRWLFRYYQFAFSDTELYDRFKDANGYYNREAADAYLNSVNEPYSEEIEFEHTVTFTNDRSWLSISTELIELFNAYDGDDSFDVPVSARLTKPWGDTYAEVMAKLNEASIAAWDVVDSNGGGTGEGPFDVFGYYVVDLNEDGLPELFVYCKGRDFATHLSGGPESNRLYYADGSCVSGNSFGILSKIYRHKESGRLLLSSWEPVPFETDEMALSYYYADTLEPYVRYEVGLYSGVNNSLGIYETITLNGDYENSISETYINEEAFQEFYKINETHGYSHIELSEYIIDPGLEDRINIINSYGAGEESSYLYDELNTRDLKAAAVLKKYLEDYEEVDVTIHGWESNSGLHERWYSSVSPGHRWASNSDPQIWVRNLPGAMDLAESAENP